MSHSSPGAALRRIGNAMIDVPDTAPREGEVRYSEPQAERRPGPVAAWCQHHAHHLSGIGVAALSAAATHPLVAGLAVVPAAFLVAGDVELAVNNAKVRAQRVHADEQATNAAATPSAGQAVTA